MVFLYAGSPTQNSAKMKKSELFEAILYVVCDCMELDVNDVLSSSREEELVTARCIIVSLGKDYGLTNTQLQRFLHFKSHNSIGYMLRSFSERKQYDRHFRFYANSAAHEMDKIVAKTGQ